VFWKWNQRSLNKQCNHWSSEVAKAEHDKLDFFGRTSYNLLFLAHPADERVSQVETELVDDHLVSEHLP